MAMIRERRLKASLEAQDLAKKAGLTEEETKAYLFDADSNTIWDGEANMPYRSPKPPLTTIKKDPTLMYSTEECCKKHLIKK
jgi:hypothetical protein